ncbi:MAG: hypothetical protein SFV52_02355 [Saprospiraceae bacterium]|nr:hypothetical protein [Saprospiraceae bacterium]
MENMFYHIGADLSKFPFMMYQIGKLENIDIQGNARNGNLRITRTPSVNSGSNIFYYPLTDVSLLDNPGKRFKLKVIDYIAILYSACEVFAMLEKEKGDYYKLSSDFAEKNATLSELYKYFNNSFLFSSILGIDHFPHRWKWNSEVPKDKNKVIRFEDTSMFEDGRTEKSLNVGKDYGILPKTIEGKISSNENSQKTMLCFIGILTRRSVTEKPILNLFEYFLPNDLRPECFNNELEFEKDNYALLLNVTHLLWEWYNAVKYNNSCLQEEIERIDFSIAEQNSNFMKSSSELKKYLTALEDEIGNLKNKRTEYEKSLTERYNELHRAFMLKGAEIYELNESHKNEIKEIRTSHQEYISKLEKDFDSIKTQMRVEYEKKINADKIQHEKIETQLREKQSQYEKAQKRTEDKHSTELEKLRIEINKLEEKAIQQSESYKIEIHNSQERNKWTLEQSEEEIKKIKQDFATELAVVKSRHEAELKDVMKKHATETTNSNTSFQKTIESLNQLITERSRKIDELQSQIISIRQNVTDEIVSQRILDNSFFTHTPSNWDRNFFDELSIRLDRLGQIEETQNHQQILLEIQKLTNEAKLTYEITKTENQRYLAEVMQSHTKIEHQINQEIINRANHENLLDRKQFYIEEQIKREELNRGEQDLKIDRAVLEIDQKQSLIEDKIRKEELNRDEQDLKIGKAVLEIDQKQSFIEDKIRKEELNRDGQDLKNDKTIFAIDSKIKQEEINREKHRNEIDREQINLDKKQMQIDFISLRNELKSESLSMREFAMQKTFEYQKFEITAKENLIKAAEMVNLQEAKNLQGERIKLEVVGKLAEIGIQVREQNVQLQKQMNEIDQKNIKNDRQLLEMNKEKMDVQNMLTQGKLDFQKNQNDLMEMMLKIKDGEFKNAATSLLIELNKKHFENDIQLQNIGLVQRENEVTLKGRENDIRSIHLTNQSVVNNLLTLQKENRLHARMEAERQSHYNLEQNLQSRIWSLQNSLERSQIELTNERALKKYLQQ